MNCCLRFPVLEYLPLLFAIIIGFHQLSNSSTWDKTTELVFRRPNLKHSLLPDPLCSIEQVLEAPLLGVIISGKFAFHSHVNYLLSVCSQQNTPSSSGLAKT